MRNHKEIIDVLKRDYDIVVTPNRLADDIREIVKSPRYRLIENIEAEMELDLRRIENAIRALNDSINEGNVNSIRTLVVLLERKAKMLGYDQPVKVNIDGAIRQIAINAGLDPDRFIEDVRPIIDSKDYVEKV